MADAPNEDDEIARFLNMGGTGAGLGEGDASDYVMDTGDKSENAVDYGDLSDDDDLPEEEEATAHPEVSATNGNHDDDGDADLTAQLNGALMEDDAGETNGTNGFHNDDDDGGLFGDGEEDNDLFGENFSSSPVQERKPHLAAQNQQPPTPQAGSLALPKFGGGLALPKLGGGQPQTSQFHASPNSMSPPDLAADDALSPTASSTMHDGEEDDEEVDEITLMQRELFKISRQHAAGENVGWGGFADKDKDEHRRWFPSWESDEVPKFTQLFRPLPGTYRGKVPAKPPKPVQPTKLTLELLPDQERSFKAATTTGKNAQDSYTGRLLTSCDHGVAANEESDDDLALSEIDESEVIGGVTMQDLAIICEDWDIPSIATVSDAGDFDESMEGTYEEEERMRPQKRRKTNILDMDASLAVQDPYLRFEEPEVASARVARQVTLDMNDPHLLIDEVAPHAKRPVKHVPSGSTRDAALGRDLAKRYDISNDAAYDLLKENHQHKIRSTLGSMATEHSLPAIKLQWPFYKVAMDSKEKRSFHRNPLVLHENAGRTYRFQKPKHQKRKHVRGREAKDLFAKAEDLSFGDNANVLLLEYSEEVPTMLSNFGMGNRLINFYRKRDADDQERPKRDIGETHVLLNQDKSPFSNFGHVNGGETVPTIQNGLYRAPVFQHKPKSNDFILSISHTWENGNKMYLRNVENLHAVGQQFPISEVPGEHSRKVTDAAKRRLRGISYRIYAKTLDPSRRGIALTNKVLMKHIPGSDIPQTRSKMREFMKYEKKAKNSEDDGYWVPPPGQVVPDSETIRGWIKPEDVCLLDTMQVGVQHLADLGIQDSKDAKEDDEAEDEENIEKMLAPWRTTKNFIQACQGKAMLKVHGEGDPTGRGEAFSMLKTNMKGGYTPRGESVAEKMQTKEKQQQSGHKYNVATQQLKYDRDITETWNRQKESLSNDIEGSDTEMDDDEPESAIGRAETPRTSFGTPAFDDSASQFSKHSVDRNEEVMIIKRKHRDAYGNWVETPVRIDNPKVIKLYRKKAKERTLARMKSVVSVLFYVLMIELTISQPQHPHTHWRQRTRCARPAEAPRRACSPRTQPGASPTSRASEGPQRCQRLDGRQSRRRVTRSRSRITQRLRGSYASASSNVVETRQRP
jgi:transcription initiation factor TFIID subunit 1